MCKIVRFNKAYKFCLSYFLIKQRFIILISNNVIAFFFKFHYSNKICDMRKKRWWKSISELKKYQKTNLVPQLLQRCPRVIFKVLLCSSTNTHALTRALTRGFTRALIRRITRALTRGLREYEPDSRTRPLRILRRVHRFDWEKSCCFR